VKRAVAANNVNSDGEPAARNTILRAVVGSNLHGLNLEGTDDTDELGVCLEPPEYVVGLRQFEQWVYRTQPEGHPSGPGDLDLTVYSLRKYVRLALAGNPTVLLILFAPKAMCSIRTTEGEQLQALAPSFASKTVAMPFIGYLQAQRQRLKGERGGRALRKPWAREHPESGYDTKYAMHMVRLGYQGVELLATGRITLPMPEPARSFVMSIRRGEVELEEVLTRAAELEQRIVDLKETSPIPNRPDKERIEEWMVRTYLARWGSKGS